jgi:hypothetical protein
VDSALRRAGRLHSQWLVAPRIAKPVSSTLAKDSARGSRSPTEKNSGQKHAAGTQVIASCAPGKLCYRPTTATTYVLGMMQETAIAAAGHPAPIHTSWQSWRKWIVQATTKAVVRRKAIGRIWKILLYASQAGTRASTCSSSLISSSSQDRKVFDTGCGLNNGPLFAQTLTASHYNAALETNTGKNIATHNIPLHKKTTSRQNVCSLCTAQHQTPKFRDSAHTSHHFLVTPQEPSFAPGQQERNTAFL